MKTIHTLLIAIDQYAVSTHNLYGCKNDAHAFGDFVAHFAAQNKLEFRKETLFDAAATREAVLETFKNFFKTVQKEDTAIVFYSGHGSQMPAPPECWEESDGMLETWVLHDSRLPNGRDLANKELRFLTHQTFDGSGAHVVFVTDCCHAGGNTRSTQIRPRMTSPTTKNVSFSDFLGFSSYQKTEKGVMPPLYPHVQLAAARADQTAKETEIEGKSNGFFSVALLETLTQTGGNLTYDDLMSRVGVRVGFRSVEQNPQLFADDNLSRMGFLGQPIAPRDQNFTLTFDPQHGEWVVSAGQINGITEGTKFELNATEIQVVATNLSTSTVAGVPQNLDKNQQHEVKISRITNQILTLEIDGSVSKTNQNALRKRVNEAFPSLRIADTGGGALTIQQIDKSLVLTQKDTKTPLFKRVEGGSAKNVDVFLGCVRDVARWYEWRGFQNAYTNLPTDALKIDVMTAADQPVLHDAASDSYVFRQPNAKTVARMKVRITNQTAGDLWISGVFFGADFEISNQFLKMEKLEAGKSTFIRYVNPKTNIAADSLPLHVDGRWQALNIYEVKQFFKIFAVVGEAFSTNFLNQSGLPIDDGEGITKRSIGELEASVADWRTFDFAFSIAVPPPPLAISEVGATSLSSLKITAPSGFSAQGILSSNTEVKRAIGGIRSPKMDGFAPVSLVKNNLAAVPPTDVLELANVQKGVLSAKNPLKIELGNTNEPTVALAYDPESGLWIPVGFSDEKGGQINITTLPEPSISTRSLGGSIKIFFQKLIIKPLTGEYNYPLVRLAQFNTDFNHFEYVENEADIKAKIKAANRVILFIHGIIGDTQDMPNVLPRIVSVGFENRYTGGEVALLTCDYESLSTRVSDTARDLQKRLEALGLGAQHGKQFELVAHSMGGLVSRYFIEKLDGNKTVSRLIQLGTPNMGSELSNVANMVKTYATMAANSSAVTGWLSYVASAGSWVFGKMMTTLAEDMNPKDSKVLKEINDGFDPKIPYFIIVGNTDMIKVTHPEKASFLQKVIKNLKERGVYEAFDQFFGEQNDLAVRVTSIEGIKNGKKRKFPVRTREVACDHMSYFIDEDSYRILGEVLNEPI